MLKKVFKLFIIFMLINSTAFALNVGQIIQYNSSTYKVFNIDNVNKTVKICPYHNYNGFFQYANWGWFYGEKCTILPLSYFQKKKKNRNKFKESIKPKTNTEQQLLKLATNPKYLNTLTAEQYKNFYKKIRNLAVMHPTREKVAAYVYMTNFTRLKSLVFAHAVNDYSMRNSKYYMLKETGETSWSIRASRAKDKQRGIEIIEKHKDSIGILAFIKDGCPFCMKQLPVLQWFRSDYHIDILLVSLNRCPNQHYLPCTVRPSAFRAFNIQSEPTMMLIIKTKSGKPKFYPVGVGLTDEMTLFSRVRYYAEGYYGEGLYTDANFLKLLKEGK